MFDKQSEITFVCADGDADYDPEAEARIDAVVMDLARLLGRQIARDLASGTLSVVDNQARET